MKIILIVITVIVSAVFILRRLFANWSERNKVSKLIQDLESNPAQAETIAKELFQKYRTINCKENFDLRKFIVSIETENLIGKTAVKTTRQLTNERFLVVTSCTDSDYDVNILGKMGDAQRVYNINYVFEYDRVADQLHIYSDYHRGGDLKALRSAFSREIEEKIGEKSLV